MHSFHIWNLVQIWNGIINCVYYIDLSANARIWHSTLSYKQQETTQIKLNILGFPKHAKRFLEENYATETLNELETKFGSLRSTQKSSLDQNFQSYHWKIPVWGNSIASGIDLHLPNYIYHS